LGKAVRHIVESCEERHPPAECFTYAVADFPASAGQKPTSTSPITITGVVQFIVATPG
jgi:hypothetical protein